MKNRKLGGESGDRRPTPRIPSILFEPPKVRDKTCPDEPDTRRAVEWFRSFIAPDEWSVRRERAFNRLYQTALGDIDKGDSGRFFSEDDAFGWYLFLAEAFVDHIWNYEPTFGSRVVPVFKALGRNLEHLRGIDGINERVARLVTSGRRQPNGSLFELLVAAAYRRAGAEVAFVAERRGVARTYDLDVTRFGRHYAVECKRLETGQYGERERIRMRELWKSNSSGLARAERSTFCDVHFTVPIDEVPDDYLTTKALTWLRSGMPSQLWNDEIGFGAIGDLDLDPLRAVLATGDVLACSSRILELLSGKYVRHANYIQLIRRKFADNPRYIKDCDLAIILRWESASEAAIEAKARDINAKLSEANDQLPDDRPGIVHIGFEAVEGDHVERSRYRKIFSRAVAFDPLTKPLEYVYCHYFVPESPPDQAWAFDETLQWAGIRPKGPHPLGESMLVLPEDENIRPGPHWSVGR